MPPAGKTVASVAQELTLGHTAVRRWVHQAGVDQHKGTRAGITSADAAEPARLRKQLREVTEERNIRACAVSFFTKGSR